MFFKHLGIIAERPLPELLAYLFLLFIIYSFGGWIVECIWTLIGKRKFENRGFLFSPICPIYGVGCFSRTPQFVLAVIFSLNDCTLRYY